MSIADTADNCKCFLLCARLLLGELRGRSSYAPGESNCAFCGTGSQPRCSPARIRCSVFDMATKTLSVSCNLRLTTPSHSFVHEQTAARTAEHLHHLHKALFTAGSKVFSSWIASSHVFVAPVPLEMASVDVPGCDDAVTLERALPPAAAARRAEPRRQTIEKTSVLGWPKEHISAACRRRHQAQHGLPLTCCWKRIWERIHL